MARVGRVSDLRTEERGGRDGFSFFFHGRGGAWFFHAPPTSEFNAVFGALHEYEISFPFSRICRLYKMVLIQMNLAIVNVTMGRKRA